MFIFRRGAGSGFNQVFRGALASGVLVGATQLELEDGQGNFLPALAGGEQFVLRLGADSGFESAIITGRDGDVLSCEPLAHSWEIGTPVIAAVMAEILEAMVQREELGNAAFKSVGTGINDVAAGNAAAQAISAHELAYKHSDFITQAAADARYSPVGGVGVFPINAQVKGVIPLLACVLPLAAGHYATPTAWVGSDDSSTATATLKRADSGAVLTSISGAGGVGKHIGTEFSLSNDADIEVFIAASAANSTAFIRGLNLIGGSL